MANNAINQSASIIANNGAAFRGANSQIFDAITNAANMFEQMQARKQATLAAERLKQAELDRQAQQAAMQPEAILAKALQNGPESLSPQERAVFEADQRMKASEVGQNAVGMTYQKYNPIALDNTSPMQAFMGAAPATASPVASPAAEALLPAPTYGGLKPPAADGQVGDPALFEKTAPAPIGQPAIKKPSEAVSVPDALKGSGVATMEGFKKDLELASNEAEFALNTGKELKDEQKGKTLAQRAIDRMTEINNELKGRGALVSAENGLAGNIGAMVRGTDRGAIGEKALDAKTRALRDEYNSLRSTLLPFYARASGLGSKSLDSNAERESMLNSFGDPKGGTYEANKQQLENLAGMIGTRSAASNGVDGKLKAKGFSDEQIKAYKAAKGIK